MEPREYFEYRKRCFDVFISKHLGKALDFTPRAYEKFHRVSRKRFRSILPADKKSPILDIGCGAGFFIYFLQNEGYVNSIGIDTGAEQIELAREAGVKNIKQIDFFEYLPLHPEEFDMVIARHIIEHFSKPEIMRLLDLMYLSLKPGGVVFIETPNASSLYGADGVFGDFTHEVGFTPGSLRQVMVVCNFSNIVIRGKDPLIHDFKSAVRVIAWKYLKLVYSVIRTLQGPAKGDRIYTHDMYAIGVKAK